MIYGFLRRKEKIVTISVLDRARASLILLETIISDCTDHETFTYLVDEKNVRVVPMAICIAVVRFLHCQQFVRVVDYPFSYFVVTSVGSVIG